MSQPITSAATSAAPRNPTTTGERLQLVREVCRELHPGSDYCTDQVVQSVAAVARHETGFGTYAPFARPGFASHNWGAQQCNHIADKNGACGAGCFPAKDTSPRDDGSSVAYQACFIVNPDAHAGALSLTKLLTVSRPGIAAACTTGDLHQVAQSMRDARYYEGFGKDQEERVHNYEVALERNAKLNATQAGVELVVSVPPPEPPPEADPNSDGGITLGYGVGFGLFFVALLRKLTKRSD